MNRRGRRIRSGLFLGIGIVLTGIVLVAYATDFFRPQELDSIDARFTIRGREDPPVKLAVVGIDGATINTLKRRGVADFDRRWHAQVLDRLRKDGVRAVLYDVQFTEPSGPTEQDAAQDLALFDAVARLRGRIVLATTETNDKGETEVLGGDENLREIGARAGSALLPEDRDGATRRVYSEVEGLESFGLAGAEVASGRKIDPRRPSGRPGVDRLPRPARNDPGVLVPRTSCAGTSSRGRSRTPSS